MLRVLFGIAVGFAIGYLYGSERAREETQRLFASAPEPVRQATGRVSDAIAGSPVPDAFKQAAARATSVVQAGSGSAAHAAASALDASQVKANEVAGDMPDSLPHTAPSDPGAPSA
jgi:hypothetical protein